MPLKYLVNWYNDHELIIKNDKLILELILIMNEGYNINNDTRTIDINNIKVVFFEKYE